MKNRTFIANLKRFIFSMINTIKTGSVLIYIIMIGLIIYLIEAYPQQVPTNSLELIFIFGTFLVVILYAIISIFNMNTKGYLNPPFDYCFRGIGKNARLYRKSLKYLEQCSFNGALQCLQDMRDNINTEKATKDEVAALNYCLGRCYQLMGYPTNALIYYEVALENNFPSSDIYFNCIRCCVENGRYDDAFAYLKTLHEKYPFVDYYYTELGMIELKRKNPEKALEHFLYAVDHNFNYAVALGGAAIAYVQLKDYEQSKKYFELAVLNAVDDTRGYIEYYKCICLSVGYNPFPEEDKDKEQKEEISNLPQG